MLNNNLEINGLISNFDEDVKRIPEQEFIKSSNLNHFIMMKLEETITKS